MRIKLLIYAFTLTFLMTLMSCQQESGKRISEGIITYKLEYPKSLNHSPLVDMLPETMKMRFKDNNTAMEIIGFGGSFGLNYITDLKAQRNYTLMRVLFNKYIYTTSIDEISFGYSTMENLKIEQTTDTMTICGYLCHKAEATISDSDGKIDIWYTNNIKVENPNANNPFKNIDGVLMKFDVVLSGIYMKVEAINVNGCTIPDDIFQIPDGYTEVTKNDLENLIKQFDKKY